ncbi:MAG: hypothetical protein O7D94_01485 [Planctomycetota bacterium]|nr:hypothetical protein [Planctomycetota bacterium]
MRRVMMILILIAATALLTGCHHGHYSGGFGYGYSSDVLLYGGHYGYGYYGHSGYGGHRGHGGHGGSGHHGGHGHH